eukprot:m.129785 g.129785  ORF g.129785 m.129785 type:complete len:382 (+) comp29427_c0_seq1:280-1425(+)
MSNNGSSEDLVAQGSEIEVLENQPFDEAHFVDDATDVESILADTPNPGSQRNSLLRDDDEMDDHRGNDTPPNFDDHDDADYDDPRHPEEDLSPDYGAEEDGADWREGHSTMDSADRDLTHEHPDPSDDNFQNSPSPEPIQWEGAYDPEDFAGLPVAGDVKDLFECIMRYTPVITDIGTKLEPFIPDYIPAVGDIDAMIKIPRLDSVDLGLGYLVVDEPCAAQSEPTVLDLKLRSISKTVHKTAVEVKQIEDVAANVKVVDNWITSITDLHRNKPPQSIQYSTPMPDINILMQEWPPQVEEMLKTVELPGADLDVELKTYVSIVCAILDIPVHRSKIEALHLLFSLFVEFKNLQYFRTDEDKQAIESQAIATETGAPDVLEL